jgi:glycosyltransferase involved in cell wall biosynthesis
MLNREIHKGLFNVVTRGFYNVLLDAVRDVDVFLPNSESEMQRVKEDFKLNAPKYVVVPNGIDLELFVYDKVQVPPELEEIKGCILSVARIEGRKCQLELIKAVKGLPYKHVLIGKPAPNHKKYFNLVMEEAQKLENVIYLGHVEHDLLPKYYKAAKVHALVSWMETPRLSSLEAAAMKCNIVVTRKGDTYDYFGDYAYYCEPDDIDSIRSALIKACEEPFNEKLYELVVNNYTRGAAAKKTIAFSWDNKIKHILLVYGEILHS